MQHEGLFVTPRQHEQTNFPARPPSAAPRLREGNGSNVAGLVAPVIPPAPQNEAATLPVVAPAVVPLVAHAIQSQLDVSTQTVQELTALKPTDIDLDRRKGFPFSKKINVLTIPSKFKMPSKLNDLVDIKQGPNKSLKDYVYHFMQEAARSKIVSDDGKLMEIMAGIQIKDIRKSDQANQARTSTAPAKNSGATNQNQTTNGNSNKNNQKSGKQNNNSSSGNNNDNKRAKTSDKLREYVPHFTTYSTLLGSRAEFFQPTQAEVLYRKPNPIRKDISKRDTNKLCRFHNDYGHGTNECNKLEDEIEFLIRQNYQAMKGYVR
ncbi:uncharacterized protein LOC133806066 [Humulus lupulus]|uniref:uncharacterized protein LOC133806066 n=1 Tax=Humulus lupulus TaxID=3486 RepID=UPI002B40D087|nr:uncharacterized protein LOC133806066 [Humulus lupulus]